MGRFRSSHPPLEVVEVTSPATYVEDMNEKWNPYSRNGIPIYVIVHREEMRESRKGSVTVGSAEAFPRQKVGEMIPSGEEGVEERKF